MALKYLSDVQLPRDPTSDLHSATRQFVTGDIVEPYTRWYGTGIADSTTVTTSTVGTGDTAFSEVVGSNTTINGGAIQFSYTTGNTSYVRWNHTAATTTMLYRFNFTMPTSNPAQPILFLSIYDASGNKLTSLSLVGTSGTLGRVRILNPADTTNIESTWALSPGTTYTFQLRYVKGTGFNSMYVDVYGPIAGVFGSIFASSIIQAGSNQAAQVRFGAISTTLSSTALIFREFGYQIPTLGESSISFQPTITGGYLSLDGGIVTGPTIFRSEFELHQNLRIISDLGSSSDSYTIFASGAQDRWYIGNQLGVEMGGNTGSDFVIVRSADNGALLDNPLTIYRDTGRANWLHKSIFAAGTTTEASINIPQGVAPTSPVNGDIWTTSAGMYTRINGATVGPLGTGGGGGDHGALTGLSDDDHPQYALSAGDTFTGAVTFNTAVTASTVPTLGGHLTNKTYVDTTIAAGTYVADLSAGTSVTVTHNLGTKDVAATVFRISDGLEVDVGITRPTTNTILLNSIVSLSGYRVMVWARGGSGGGDENVNVGYARDPGDFLNTTGGIIAHRGGGDRAPELTMPGYRASVGAGIEAIEVSVWRTSDNVWVLGHDESLLRTTGLDIKIKEVPYSFIRTMNVLASAADNKLGSWWDTNLPPIPTLDELLDEFGGRVIILLEDKSYVNQNQLDLIDLIVERGLVSSVVWKNYEMGGKTQEARAAGMLSWTYMAQGTTRTAAWVTANASLTDYWCVWYDGAGGSSTMLSETIAACVATHPTTASTARFVWERDAVYALGIKTIMATDPVYIMPTRKAAKIDSGRRNIAAPGDKQFTGQSYSFTPDIADNIYTFPTKGSTEASAWFMGSMCPITATTYTLEFEFCWPDTLGSATQHGDVAFCRVTDEPFRHQTSTTVGGGYHTTFRVEGDVQLYKHYTGWSPSSTQLASDTTRPFTMAADRWYKHVISVTPTTISLTVSDVLVPATTVTVSSNDTTHRGGYFCLSRASTTVATAFRNFKVVTS